MQTGLSQALTDVFQDSPGDSHTSLNRQLEKIRRAEQARFSCLDHFCVEKVWGFLFPTPATLHMCATALSLCIDNRWMHVVQLPVETTPSQHTVVLLVLSCDLHYKLRS